MFNYNDYGMAKAQQERNLAQAAKQNKPTRRSNLLVAIIQRVTARQEEPRSKVRVSPEPAKA